MPRSRSIVGTLCLAAFACSEGIASENAVIGTDARRGVVVAPALEPRADTGLREHFEFANDGRSNLLRVSGVPGERARALVRFDQTAVEAAVGGESLYSATLQLGVVNHSQSRNGDPIAAHRMTRSWIERSNAVGATWLCAKDSNIFNLWNDCVAADGWGMDSGDAYPLPYTEDATDSVHVYSDGAPTDIQFDVTDDVRAFLDGAENYGWMLLAGDESASSARIDLSSREGPKPPKLILDVGADLCPSNPGGTMSSAGTGGAAGMGLSDVCKSLIDKATMCGIPAPDPSKCKADNACEDGCTLAGSCQDLRDLAAGKMPPALQTCFQGCP